MGCWHGWHGCGPWNGPPYGESWYGPAEWYEETERPLRRRHRQYRRLDREAAAEELEAQLADLRDQLRRIEGELSAVRSGEEATAGGP
jgi:hypothetical protein